MQKSEYMAMMQGDDGTLGSAELIAAYEQGIDDLRSAVAGMKGKLDCLGCVAARQADQSQGHGVLMVARFDRQGQTAVVCRPFEVAEREVDGAEVAVGSGVIGLQSHGFAPLYATAAALLPSEEGELRNRLQWPQIDAITPCRQFPQTKGPSVC